MGSTIIDFYIVRRLHQAQLPLQRKPWLFLSIGINVGLLLYFKYANFFVENVNSFFEQLNWETMDWVEVALPIGISFYTFQTLTYSIDVYRRVHPPL